MRGIVRGRSERRKRKKFMKRQRIWLLGLGSMIDLSAANVKADDSALIDALIKKGILTKQEAEKLEAEASKEPLAAPQGTIANIKIGDWVQELDLYGDMRFREYYQNYEQQLPSPAVNGFDKNIQRQRLRFRLRLLADFKLADNF